MKIFVKVKTGARHENIKQIDDTHFVVTVSARPERGRANKAVVQALAEHLKIAPWRIGIVTGHTSKEKIIEIV